MCSSFASGPLASFPVIGMRVMLVDGSAHESDSTPRTFEIATGAAMRTVMKRGEPQILEPILRVEITAPEMYAEAIVADLKVRNGRSDGRGRRSRNGITMSALIPASGFIGYAEILSHLTEAQGSFLAQFDRYAPVPSEFPDDPSFQPATALRA